MADVPPAIAEKIDELLTRAKDLLSSHQQNVDILSKTIEIKDFFGLKMRASEMFDALAKLHAIAAQIEILRSLPYDVTTEAPTSPGSPPKRRASTQMAAVQSELLSKLDDEKK